MVGSFLAITLQAFEEQILRFQLVKEVGIQNEGCIVEDVAKRRTDDQWSSSILIWPWAKYKGPEYSWDRLRER